MITVQLPTWLAWAALIALVMERAIRMTIALLDLITDWREARALARRWKR